MAETLKEEVLREVLALFNSVKLPKDAAKADVTELKALRAALAHPKTSIPGNSFEDKRAQACYLIKIAYEQIQGLSKLSNNLTLVEKFSEDIGLLAPTFRNKK